MIFDEIKKLVSEQLEVDESEIKMETQFEDLGADSLDLFQVVIEIEENYGIQFENAENIKCVADVVKYVEEAVKNK